MNNIFVSLLLLLTASPRAGAQELECGDIKPRIKSLKIMIMQPVKRGKVWLEGEPGSVFQTSCDRDGFKTGEAEYQRKTLASRKRFIRKTRQEMGTVCGSVKSGETDSGSAGGNSRSALENFCRENRKKNFDAVMIYEAAGALDPSGASDLIRQIFRFYDSEGLPAEDRRFDSYMELEARTAYKYDDKSELAEKTDYGPDGAALKREVRSFDKKANSRTVSVFNGHGMLTQKTVYEYRKDGTCSKEVRTAYDAGEQMLSRSETYHDAKGLPSSEVVYEGSSENPVYEYRCAYKSDRNGNWTEERKTKFLTYGNKRLQDKSAAPRIIKREITYY